MADRFDEKRINEALDLLSELAREKRADLQDVVSDKYSNLRSVLDAVAERSRRQSRDAHARYKARAKESASRVDRIPHGNPRPYVGRTTLAFLTLGYVFTLGYFFARSRK